MIYAIRTDASGKMLIELPGKQALTSDTRYVSPEYARQWVKDRMAHETGLGIDYDGRVRYAAPKA